MDGRQKKLQTLQQIEETIKSRRDYLATIERDIQTATETGAYAMGELQADINTLNNEKARLLRQNLSLAQSIRERKSELAL